MPDLEKAKTRLEAQLAELNARLEHLERDLAEPLNPDSSERAVEMEDDASLEAQCALVSNEILSVRRALDRIAEGSYGTCVQCGNEISPQRLEVRPEAALCVSCASKL
ncbi:MAG: TraR/DksA family transcriptional regulator [Novosphingobium sp.]|nr:TraR/DksA family transcriptional regulator [Novosphingobium sp.]